MIYYLNGNIFNSTAECIVNTVNCEGVMGKGLALQFKQRYPKNFEYYKSKCDNLHCHVGNVIFFKEDDKIIANFPTKDKWRYPSKYEYIEAGLKDLVKQVQENEIASIAIPPLGCGLGGLDIFTVSKMITSHFENLDINVYLYNF